MKIITKLNAFILSILLLAIPLTAIIIQELCNYRESNWCQSHWSLIGNVGKITLWPSLILFITLILSCFFKASVFESWKKFAVWAVPVILILTYFITRDTGGSNFFSMDFSVYFLAIVYGLFFLTSLVIIAISAFKKN